MYSVLSSVLLWVIILTLSVTTAFTDINHLHQVFCANWFIFSSFSLLLVNVNYMLSPVCLSAVTLVHPTQAVVIFGNFSTAFGTLAIR